MNNVRVLSDDTEMFKKQEIKDMTIDEYRNKYQFDEIIEKFYQDGIFVLDGKEIKVRNVYIIEHDINGVTKYMLYYEGSKLNKKDDMKLKRIVRFRDTSLFEKLINENRMKLVNNKLAVTIDKIYDTNCNWDGKYNELTPEAMYEKEHQIV